MKQRVCILGSTGSIGRQALEVIRLNRDLFEVVAISATGRNQRLLALQVEEFQPEVVATLLNAELPEGPRRITGENANERLIQEVDADIYLIALSGTSGIMPSYLAAKTGRRIALANKESLVAAGRFITERASLFGSEIIPVDSEHSAIFQCLLGQDTPKVKRIILTASGGPFLRRPLNELERVSPQEALEHPLWNMGPKITVDSATMMNKGLEVIEARWLFNLPGEKISVVVHPQGVIHSMVEFEDGAVLAQMGSADMKIPISFALGFPFRIESGASPLELTSGSPLTFEDPDPQRFPLLKLAYEALEEETTLPVILNTANEVAVEAFLSGRLPFTGIAEVVKKTMDALSARRVESMEDVMALHLEAQKVAKEMLNEAV